MGKNVHGLRKTFMLMDINFVVLLKLPTHATGLNKISHSLNIYLGGSLVPTTSMKTGIQ